MQRQRDGGKARRVGARDRAQFDASPGMDCRRTPGVALRSRRAGCPETAASGWPFSWLLLFGHSKRSDSLAGRRVKSRHGCRATKERKKPSIATEVAPTKACVEARHGCRALKERKEPNIATKFVPTKIWADARQGCRAPKERKEVGIATEVAPTKMHGKERKGSGARTKRSERKSTRRAGQPR